MLGEIFSRWQAHAEARRRVIPATIQMLCKIKTLIILPDNRSARLAYELPKTYTDSV